MKFWPKNIKKPNKKSLLLWVLIVILLLVAGTYAYITTRPASHTTVNPSPTPSIPMGGHGKDTTVHAGPSHDTTPTPQSNATPTPVSSAEHPVSDTLAKPTGQVLNTHKAGSSDMMESTCNSVPGATCYVQATMNGQTVALSSAKPVPDSGGVIIDWNTNQLTAGTWSVQLVASKAGSKAYSDPDSLEVTQ